MSGGISAATLATMATVVSAGVAVYGAVEAGKNKPMPQIKPPEPPPIPKQGAKGADRVGAMGANAAAARPGGAMAGNGSTFLTGPSGIDPGSLNLGRNTLLGQ